MASELLPAQRQARRAGAMFRSRLTSVQPPGIAVRKTAESVAFGARRCNLS